MSATREQNYYNEVRNANENLWDAINALAALQREWDALDYGTTLDDGAGAHAGITKTELGAVVFATTDAFVALLDGGHATNMAKLLP